MSNISKIERLNSIRTEMTLFWSGFFIIGGGSLTLFLNRKSTLEIILSIIGAIFTVAIYNAYLIRRKDMLTILDNLEEK